MNDDDSFHDGERFIQACAGATAIADRNVALLSVTVVPAARPFIAAQPLVALGSVDAGGRAWASVVFGQPGFVQAPDGASVVIGVPETARDRSDPVWTNVEHHPDLGMLLIDFTTRRRYRVNGAVRQVDEAAVQVAVREAYPNCPKYIQRRRLLGTGDLAVPVRAARGTLLHGAVEAIVAQADTLFVASRHVRAGADVSHRGGPPGFVRQVDATTLRIPDYAGNGLFNTLGNLHADPRAGLCILDFAGGRLLQLTGTAAVRWHRDAWLAETGGTGRCWEFKVQEWILRATPQPLQWEYVDASPFNPAART